ncbi:MAG: sensor histidine kinase [Candidatus Dormibacteraceae bacterium]
MSIARNWWRRLASVDQQTLDVLLVGFLVVASVADWALTQHSRFDLPDRLVVAGSVILRRRHPLAGFAIAIVAKTPFGIGPEGFLALGIDAYAVGAYSTVRWRSFLALLIGGATLIADGSAFLFIVMAWLIGDTIRDRRAAEAALERERAASDRGAVEERARIARELHDVVAHAVSVIVVQAEAAKNMLHRDPARASQAIEAVASSGREALGELRQLLQVLDSSDSPAPLAPAPTANDIDELVNRVRVAGQQVEYRIEGKPRHLAPALGLTAYRVVQEALTNTVRYATGARTEVTVGYEPDRLIVEVVDHGGRSQAAAAVGSGNGLRGIRERVAILGGAISTEPTEDGGFAVRATLPYPSA